MRTEKLISFPFWKFQQSNNFKNRVGNIQYEKGEYKRNGIILMRKNITKQNRHKQHQLDKSGKHKTVHKTGKFLFAAFNKVIIKNSCGRKKERKQKRQSQD